MTLTKQHKIIIAVVIGFLFINFSLIPYFQKREAIRIAKDVLKHWDNGDLSLAIDYWEIQEN